MADVTVDQKLDILAQRLQALLELNGNPYYDERGQLKVQSGNFNVFHGKGVVKFSILLPQRDGNGFVSKEGGIFVEAAPTTGRKRPDGLPEYDWNQKITFGLNPTDIAQLVDPSNNGDVRLIHKDQRRDPPEFHKTFTFKPPSGNFNTHNLYVEDVLAGSKVFVPFTPGQYLEFQRLVLGALPLLIGWPR